MDYDTDDDGLIEISTLAQLDAMRWDIDGDGYSDHGGPLHVGFPNPAGADGLSPPRAASATSWSPTWTSTPTPAAAADAGDAYWNSGFGWLPIGIDTHDYSAVFEGNGHVIRNLYIDSTSKKQLIATRYSTTGTGRPPPTAVGLFERVATGGVIRNVG